MIIEEINVSKCCYCGKEERVFSALLRLTSDGGVKGFCRNCLDEETPIVIPGILINNKEFWLYAAKKENQINKIKSNVFNFEDASNKEK